MRSDVLASGYLPELGPLYPGKVRDNHVVGNKRVLVATDRISVFDVVLPQLIPQKGAILNAIAMWFFEKTKDIAPNHVIDLPDPNVIVARQCEAFPVEMVVRGYLTGSAWEDVQSGRFEEKYGFKITAQMVEGGKLQKNCKLKEPIVTPTTKAKEGHDVALTAKKARELIGAVYDELVEKSLKLYERGAELAAERGLILVDTKYEFGAVGPQPIQVILIDEVNTPDSSRYWYAREYKPGRDMEELSKQFVRDIIKRGSKPSELTQADINETTRRYIELYEQLTGQRWAAAVAPQAHYEAPIRQRIVNNLIKKNYIKGGFVQIIAGSEKDDWFVKELVGALKEHKIPHGQVVCSAHKNTRELLSLIDALNKSIEPVVAITVAGGSDALSGMVAHNLKFPVIACPPHKDQLDYLINIHSILQMPSQVPSMLVRRPENAVLAAERILSLNNPYFERRAAEPQPH